MPGADGMSSKFMKNAFVGWTFTAGLYYPPDFDASKLVPLKQLRPRGEKREQVLNIRMMFPFTMVCDSCGEYNYTGTKFTAKVEDIKHEKYLGLKVYRFYGRCRHCWSEFTFKTDPKNSDYTMESGGKRTYEAWKDADLMEAQLKKEKEEEKSDQMKALEQKSIDVAAEMQRLEDLDAIRTMNKRLGKRDESIEGALEYLFKQQAETVKAEERLTDGEAAELEDFKEAQVEEKRRKLDAEVDDDDDVTATAGGSSSSTAGASGSSSSSASTNAAAGVGVAGAGIASAIAERAAAASAARSSVGAKFTVVKRKAPEPSAEIADTTDSASKKQCTGAAGGPSMSEGTAAQPSAAGARGAGGLAGLGAYDSDSS